VFARNVDCEAPLFPSIGGANFIRFQRMKLGVVFLFVVYNFQNVKPFPLPWRGGNLLVFDKQIVGVVLRMRAESKHKIAHL
jgi:hypothetical protein